MIDGFKSFYMEEVERILSNYTEVRSRREPEPEDPSVIVEVEYDVENEEGKRGLLELTEFTIVDSKPNVETYKI